MIIWENLLRGIGLKVFTAGYIVKVELHLVDGSTVEIEDSQLVVSKVLKELTGLHGLSMWV